MNAQETQIQAQYRIRMLTADAPSGCSEVKIDPKFFLAQCRARSVASDSLGRRPQVLRIPAQTVWPQNEPRNLVLDITRKPRPGH